jgi:uncharacterized protein (TIGR03437 family)
MTAPRITSVLLLFLSLTYAQTPDRPTPTRNDDDDHQAERIEWFYSQRRYPNASIPAGARRNAILEINRMDAAARAARQVARREAQGAVPFALTTDSANWTLIGPKPTDPGPSATAGRIAALAVDPRDNNVVYAGAAEGGVWKTIDGGVNWAPLTDDQVSLATGSIALDPRSPDTIYVGTGEGNFNGDGYYGAGILKSTNGGNSWTNILGPFALDYIAAIAVSPTDSNVVICGSRRNGIFRSADAGATWSSVLPGAPGDSVVFDPTSGDSVWAALGSTGTSSRAGVYHSTDAGLTWTRVTGTGTASLPTANIGRIELAIAPSSPATMYAQIASITAPGTSTAPLLGVYKTTDAGLTWRNTTTASLAIFWGGQVWYYNTLRVSPTDPNVVWAGGLQPLRTLNGGTTWQAPAQAGPNGVAIHVDFHAFAFTPDGSKLYIGNDGGVYQTTDVTSAIVNWTDLNSTLAITQFYPGMSMDPGTSGAGMVGAQDNGTQLFDGAGKWNDNRACGDGGYTAMDTSIPPLAFGACQNVAIRKSATANGTTLWAEASYGIDDTDTTQFISPLMMDPSNPQTIYFGTYRLWSSQDSGGIWSAASADLTGGRLGTIKTIAIAPSDSNTVYVGTTNAKVQVTTEGSRGIGAAWTDRSAGLPPRTVTAMAVDPVNSAIAYVTFSGFPTPAQPQGYVFKTTDGGATWTNISGNLPALPVNGILIDPDLPNTLYIATDAGVMITTDGGVSWSSLGKGLPKVVVMSLAMSRAARVLRAATHGRSAWEIAIPLGTQSLQPAIDTLTPATVDAGSGNFVLAVAGSNFVPGTLIRWNGQNRKTTFVDHGHVTAQITADDVALLGRAAVLAFNPSSGGGASIPRNFNIGGAPKIVAAGFVNAANPSAGNVVAPRSIASIYGTNLAPSVVVAGAPPLPNHLAGTAVQNGLNVFPLFFVSPTQINVQTPITTGNYSLSVIQGTQSVTVPVVVRPFAPGLFTANAQGTGQASTVIANTGTLAAPVGTTPDSRPAKQGEYISIYCTGLGSTDVTPGLGGPSPSNPLAHTNVTPTVKIGGIDSQVIFSGLAPGFVGLNQVNVQVPDGVTPGDAVTMVLSIAGATSNTVTIAVAAK